MRASVHTKCAASVLRDSVWLICGRSHGHSVLMCFDPDEDRHFIAPDRVGFPKIQPLGVRKLRPIAAQLGDALNHLRKLIDPESGVEADDVAEAREYLFAYVEAPLAEALGAIDPQFRAEERDR